MKTTATTATIRQFAVKFIAIKARTGKRLNAQTLFVMGVNSPDEAKKSMISTCAKTGYYIKIESVKEVTGGQWVKSFDRNGNETKMFITNN